MTLAASTTNRSEAGSTRGSAPHLDLLQCPAGGGALSVDGSGMLVPESREHAYTVNQSGIPLFAEAFCSDDAQTQKDHYDAIADAYVTNLTYAHTQEYMAYLDRVFCNAVDKSQLGTIAEICCGHGEAFELLEGRYGRGVGVDVSIRMLTNAVREHPDVEFIQGDATMLPLRSGCFDSVFMLGGIHHVSDRTALFSEIHRILKPGGRFYFREPVSDFFAWRWIRAIVYRLAPGLDHDTERPLLHVETVPVLETVGLQTRWWRTHGFFGFCVFMNSDVLVFNRLFRFVPGIRAITRFFTRVDEWTVGLPGMSRAGLQVVGCAVKEEPTA